MKNLIVKSNYTIKYTNILISCELTISKNTNLIIPEGITLTKNNAKLIFDCSDSSSTSNIFVFGTLLGNHDNSNTSIKSAIDIGTKETDSGYVCVIIGPNGRYVRNTNKAPIYAFCKNVNFLLYPECELKTENSSNAFGNDMIAGKGGNLYLNRFIKVNKLLSGEAEESINVIYPNIPAEYNFEQKEDGKVYYIYTEFFPYFYWNDTLATHAPVQKLDPDAPIEFDGSKILQLSSSEFSKYDVKLWDQCKVESGIYSFNEFVNISRNKDKLIDVNTLEDLFMDGKTYKTTGLLQNMSDIIYPGLKGTVPINIITTQDTVKLFGNNTEYTGTITVPSTITKIYFSENSLVNITRTGDTINPLNGITFYLLGDNKLDLEKYSTDLYMNFDNTNGGNLEIVDSSDSITNVKFLGNYINYNGNIKIPNTITDIYLKSDLFYKIKHGDKADLSGLTYHLLEDTQVDLKNNSTFDMKLDGYDGSSNYYKIILTDSSNPTKITKVIFSGNNINYKENSTANNNTGIVELTQYITKVEFKASNSFVNLKTYKYNKTLVNGSNELSTKEYDNLTIACDGGTYNKSENVSYYDEVIDNREVVENMNKYNIDGVTWNTYELEGCFKDGSTYKPEGSSNTAGLLNNMPNFIYANLTGSKNITIYTDNTEVIIIGDNSGYTGTITIPDSITDVYLKKLSIIQNGIIYNSVIYIIKIDEDDNITYKVNDAIKEPENLELKFHYIDINLNKKLKEIETQLTSTNAQKETIQKNLDDKTSELTSTKADKRLVEEELERIKKELADAKQTSTSNSSSQSKENKTKPSKSVSTQTGDGSIKHNKNEYKYVWKLCENGDTVRYTLDHHHNINYSCSSDEYCNCK